MAPLRSVSKVVMLGAAPEPGKGTGKGSAAAPATCQIRPSFAASTTPSAVSVQAVALPCPSKTIARSGCHRHAPFEADTHSLRRLSSKTGPTLSPNWPLSPTHSVVVPWTAHNRPGGKPCSPKSCPSRSSNSSGDQLTGRACAHSARAAGRPSGPVPSACQSRSCHRAKPVGREWARAGATHHPAAAMERRARHRSAPDCQESQATSSRPCSGRSR